MAADAFEVAFVIEELVRDVEAVWIAFGGINHDDEDRCARHAFCASACFSDWDRYDNPGCRETKRCAYCDPEGARGCRACARRLRRHLILVRRNFDLYPADVLAGVVEERARLEEFCVQYRLPSLCDLAPLPVDLVGQPVAGVTRKSGGDGLATVASLGCLRVCVWAGRGGGMAGYGCAAAI